MSKQNFTPKAKLIMKSIFTILTLLVILLISFSAYAQDDTSEVEIKIDPRQYVTVQYKKTSTQGKLDTVWNWENRKNVSNQKINFIDVDGEMKIDFSKLGLIANKDFEGTVSLEAEISGVNGTRKIEVNPYSEIGVQRIPIGIKSEPPSEIAKKLLNMIRELRDADSIYSFISIYGSYTLDDVNRKTVIENKTKSLLETINSIDSKLEDLVPDALTLEMLVLNKNLNESPNKLDLSKSKKELKGKIDAMLRQYEEFYNDDRGNYIRLFKNSFNYISKKVDIVLDYLTSFESGGEDATKAFLSLINKDLIGYKSLKNTFVNAQRKLSVIDLNYKDDDKRLDSILLSNANLISETCKSLAEISRFKGSTFENILMGLANAKRYSFDRTKYVSKFEQDEQEKHFYFNLIDMYLQELSEKLSSAAGKMIYKKLVYATIDLSKSGAKNGEVMNVYLTWILDSKRDSLANSPRLPIGKYYLRETGWRMEVADMFALIKRIKEADVDQTKVSPSNFKGSGGAVLMWTFNKEDKGLEVTKKSNADYSVKRRNRLINFIEPSIGFNVSYLDFSTDKDVEIGTGLQLGLFKNKIFFGYGINLHMLSPKNQSPTYFYIGFSFARLSDLFKNSNSVIALQ